MVILSNQTLLQFLAHSLVSLGSTAILSLSSSIHFLFSFLYHHVPLGAYIPTSPFSSRDLPVTCHNFTLRFSSLSANCFSKSAILFNSSLFSCCVSKVFVMVLFFFYSFNIFIFFLCLFIYYI